MNIKTFKNVCAAAAFSVAALTFSVGCSGDEAAKRSFDPSNERHQAGYAFGRSFANDMKNQNEDIDMDILLMAVKEVVRGEESQLSDSAITAVMARVRHDQRERQRLAQIKLEEEAAAAMQKFFEENKTKEGVVTTESGLQYIVLKEGTGPKPKIDDYVRLNYSGTFLDGTTFDFSREPTIFPITGSLKCWTEALLLMNTGSKLKIFAPPELAYGQRGSRRTRPQVGPNTALIFEIELVEIIKK